MTRDLPPFSLPLLLPPLGINGNLLIRPFIHATYLLYMCMNTYCTINIHILTEKEEAALSHFNILHTAMFVGDTAGG